MLQHIIEKHDGIGISVRRIRRFEDRIRCNKPRIELTDLGIDIMDEIHILAIQLNSVTNGRRDIVRTEQMLSDGTVRYIASVDLPTHENGKTTQLQRV